MRLISLSPRYCVLSLCMIVLMFLSTFWNWQLNHQNVNVTWIFCRARIWKNEIFCSCDQCASWWKQSTVFQTKCLLCFEILVSSSSNPIWFLSAGREIQRWVASALHGLTTFSASARQSAVDAGAVAAAAELHNSGMFGRVNFIPVMGTLNFHVMSMHFTTWKQCLLKGHLLHTACNVHITAQKFCMCFRIVATVGSWKVVIVSRCSLLGLVVVKCHLTTTKNGNHIARDRFPFLKSHGPAKSQGQLCAFVILLVGSLYFICRKHCWDQAVSNGLDARA